MTWPVKVSGNYLFDNKQVISRCDVFDDSLSPISLLVSTLKGIRLSIKEQGVACLV